MRKFLSYSCSHPAVCPAAGRAQLATTAAAQQELTYAVTDPYQTGIAASVAAGFATPVQNKSSLNS
jgi:CTP:molybdopterin cytidylyltransferase MocA